MAKTVKKLFDRSQLQVETGTAAMVMASLDWTLYQPLLTLAPTGDFAMYDVKVCIDLAKASTGFAAGYTTETLIATIARKVDGTNSRVAANKATTAITGTNAAGSMLELDLGTIGPGEQAQIKVKLSVEGADISLPFSVYYRSGAVAVLTPAA